MSKHHCFQSAVINFRNAIGNTLKDEDRETKWCDKLIDSRLYKTVSSVGLIGCLGKSALCKDRSRDAIRKELQRDKKVS